MLVGGKSEMAGAGVSSVGTQGGKNMRTSKKKKKKNCQLSCTTGKRVAPTIQGESRELRAHTSRQHANPRGKRRNAVPVGRKKREEGGPHLHQ